MENEYNAIEILRICRKFAKKEVKNFLSKNKNKRKKEKDEELFIAINIISCLRFLDSIMFNQEIEIFVFVDKIEDSEKKESTIMTYAVSKMKEFYIIIKENLSLIVNMANIYYEEDNIKGIQEYISKVIISACIHEVRHRFQYKNIQGNKNELYSDDKILKALNVMCFFDEINTSAQKDLEYRKFYTDYLNNPEELDSRLIENLFLCEINENKKISINKIKQIIEIKSIIL